MFSLSIEAYQNYPLFFAAIAAIAFAMGASIGSFLNVVIYRIPLGLSVNEPRRSFCPRCRYQIPWYLNLPLVSWLLLRGKCANCSGTISARYVFVEFITGLCFVLAVFKFNFPEVIAYWVMLSLFIATIYIDIDHYIIPNEITLGGLAAGILFSATFPQLHLSAEMLAERGPLMGRVWSTGWALLGAAAGYALLWAVVHLGKIAFGRRKQEFDRPVAFKIHEVSYETGECEPVLFYESGVDGDAGDSGADDSEQARMAADGDAGWERQPWSDMFARPADKLIMTCEQVSIDGAAHSNVELTLFETRLEIRRNDATGAPQTIDLETVRHIEGTCSKVVIPREAMGWGDVKFLAMAGAFLGWQSTLFTLVMASLLGSVLALSMSALGRREWAARLPFGPYLVFGATLWLFYGRELLTWYWQLAAGSE